MPDEDKPPDFGQQQIDLPEDHSLPFTEARLLLAGYTSKKADFTSFSSSVGGMGSMGGANFKSVSTSTRIVNGKRITTKKVRLPGLHRLTCGCDPLLPPEVKRSPVLCSLFLLLCLYLCLAHLLLRACSKFYLGKRNPRQHYIKVKNVCAMYVRLKNLAPAKCFHRMESFRSCSKSILTCESE
ncbi:hypothetical protein QQF64_033496 [Cirrhinus molitorella]|uniref:Uncharacterized protein n=1 Tax=Cirrhinus molitorella TaxID=172907 RepID=A0ABR3MU13_9TELE